MPDFREELYRSYVSRFKAHEGELVGVALSSFQTWCSYKYLPLLKGLEPASEIVELGCGPGYMLEFLERQGFTRTQGVDISEEQVLIARNRGQRASSEDVFSFLEQREAGFDVIIAIDLMEHFYKDEILRLLGLVFRALRPGGRLIFQTPNGEGLFPRQIIYGDFTHLTVLSPGSALQVLSACGFVSARFYETGPVPKNVTGWVRLVLWRLLRLGANFARIIETGKSQAVWTENMICYCEKPVQD